MPCDKIKKMVTSKHLFKKQRIMQKQFRQAKQMEQVSHNSHTKKMQNGDLSDYYPQIQRDNAQKAQEEKQKIGYSLKYITQPYRFCIFPYGQINQMEQCQALRRQSKERMVDCQNSMCLNCCNHLTLIFQYLAQRSMNSEMLGFADTAGESLIKKMVGQEMIKNCRQACNTEYQTQEIQVIHTPAKDNKLGTTQSNPGFSCIDILLNGGEINSGIYWIKTQHTTIQVFCDQITDGGGWTLFFSYSHHPYENYEIDSTQIPTDPTNGKSHVNLNQLEFQQKDVLELRFQYYQFLIIKRFYCKTSNYNKQIHFKTKNQGFIKTAMTGDQTRIENLKDIQQIEPTLDLYMMNFEPKSWGNNNKGGFWDRPFGNEGEYWSVKGSKGTWDCGDDLQGLDGNRFDTLHNIYFRGEAPSKESLVKRYLEKLQNDKFYNK